MRYTKLIDIDLKKINESSNMMSIKSQIMNRLDESKYDILKLMKNLENIQKTISKLFKGTVLIDSEKMDVSIGSNGIPTSIYFNPSGKNLNDPLYIAAVSDIYVHIDFNFRTNEGKLEKAAERSGKDISIITIFIEILLKSGKREIISENISIQK